jgi:hypothetical protein
VNQLFHVILLYGKNTRPYRQSLHHPLLPARDA